MNEDITSTTDLSRWNAKWQNSLPYLALVAPSLWFLAALIRAAGIGTLQGDLWWVSVPEGFIMTLGAPFFVATFIFLGLQIAKKAPKTGTWVIVLGVFGSASLAYLSGIRVLLGSFAEVGIDPDTMNSAMESGSIWILGIVVQDLLQFIAWIIAGFAVMKNQVAPKWAGLALVLGVPSLITAQAFYYNLEIFWPLSQALWLIGVWGVMAARKNLQ